MPAGVRAIWSLLHKPFWRGVGRKDRGRGEEEGREGNFPAASRPGEASSRVCKYQVTATTHLAFLPYSLQIPALQNLCSA